MRRRPPFVATLAVLAAFFTAAFFTAAFFPAAPATAQQASAPAQSEATAPPAQPEAPPSSAVITTMPNQAASSRDVWFAQDLEDAEERSKRSRNALIATSASFGLGAILAGIGVSQCQVITRPVQEDEILCNNAGDVLVPLGGTIAGLSAIGMITSGIILGVSNKRKREIQRDMRRAYYGSRLKWHPPSGGFVF